MVSSIRRPPSNSQLIRIMFRLFAIVAFVPLSAIFATEWNVNSSTGNDSFSGLSSDAAFRTIQAAVKQLQPGDTLTVAPGIYQGPIIIPAEIRGTRDAPIVIRRAGSDSDATIITGADEAIRAGLAEWELVDASIQLYRARYAKGWPARVLYDNVDLYPYASLEALKAFQNQHAPGPQHGYFYDEVAGCLYLRLNPRYAPRGLNPAQYTIAVAPPTGEGFEGTLIGRPEHYGIGVLGEGPAFIHIEGFIFECPGVAGVYIESSDVIVEDCTFLGCRTGVSGNYQESMIDPAQQHAFKNLKHAPASLDRVAGRVTVRRCFFTQHPTFEDIGECISLLPSDLPEGRESRSARLSTMWHRKSVGGGLPSELFKYEIGILCRVGRDWTLESCLIVNAFEGLSCHATAGSENLVLRGNLFARIADNAIECEDWAQGMTANGNIIIDTFEPFSWQPLRGLPWPTDILFDGNVIANTPVYAQYWKNSIADRGAFKIGASASNWRDIVAMKDVPRSPLQLGGKGVQIINNLVWFPGGRLCTIIGERNTEIPGIQFLENILATDTLSSRDPKKEIQSSRFTFRGNTVLPSTKGEPGPGPIAAGEGGQVIAFSDFNDPAKLDFRHASGSSGIPFPDLSGLMEALDANDASAIRSAFEQISLRP